MNDLSIVTFFIYCYIFLNKTHNLFQLDLLLLLRSAFKESYLKLGITKADETVKIVIIEKLKCSNDSIK